MAGDARGESLDRLIADSEEAIKRLDVLYERKKKAPFLQRVKAHLSKNSVHLTNVLLAGTVFVVAVGRLDQRQRHEVSGPTGFGSGRQAAAAACRRWQRQAVNIVSERGRRPVLPLVAACSMRHACWDATIAVQPCVPVPCQPPLLHPPPPAFLL